MISRRMNRMTAAMFVKSLKLAIVYGLWCKMIVKKCWTYFKATMEKSFWNQ